MEPAGPVRVERRLAAILQPSISRQTQYAGETSSLGQARGFSPAFRGIPARGARIAPQIPAEKRCLLSHLRPRRGSPLRGILQRKKDGLAAELQGNSGSSIRLSESSEL
jgi:hypothetical protein